MHAVTDFKWGFVPGLLWGLLAGAIVGCAVVMIVGNPLMEKSAQFYLERGQLEQKCIAGNDGACRVLEARK